MIKKISLMLLVLIAASCSFFIRPKITFEIENNTSKDLNMKVFGKSKLQNEIMISPFSKYEVTHSYSSPGTDGSDSPFNEDIVDSIVVIFENSKIIKYYCFGDILYYKMDTECMKGKKNPFIFEYIKTSQLKSTTTKRLVYDESDFSKAEPL